MRPPLLRTINRILVLTALIGLVGLVLVIVVPRFAHADMICAGGFV